MKLESIKPSPQDTKRYVAIFSNPKKTTHFGLKGGSTFIDHRDEKKKSAYLARHKPLERWNDPVTAGALARWILWNKPTLNASISDFKKRFNL